MAVKQGRCWVLFFIGVFGADAKVAPVGELQNAACPVCTGRCNMAVVKRYNYFHAFFIPLFKWGKGYLATCGCCASMMELNPEKGQELERTGHCNVNQEDFHIIRDNNTGRCPNCKAFNPPGSRYCNSCGSSL